MNTRKSFCILLALALLVAIGCGKSEQQKRAEEAAKQLEEAGKSMADAGEKMKESIQGGGEDMAEAMKKMGEAMTGGKKVEPVDFRELKALLPESIPGMKRTNATGERNAAFGINVSEAEGNYETEDGSSNMSIKITDLGSISGLTAMAAFGWAMADFDRETDNGYEKTTKYSGHKAFEEYDNSNESGKLQVLVAERFIVEANGYNVKMDAIKGALDKVDLGKLEGWKNHGVQE